MTRFTGPPSHGTKSAPTRLLYAAIGWCAVGFAIAGTLLPGLPTTIFVLAAAWCFSRSSQRFEQWLHDNPLLGPVMRRLAPGGGMPASAKRAALMAMWTAILISSVVLLSVHWIAALATLGLGVIGTLSILFGVHTAQEQ
jgi:uncharacterized membrane protein YbaN (DUF454 family)